MSDKNKTNQLDKQKHESRSVSPIETDAVKEALDIAQSFGALKDRRPGHSAFNVTNFDDSISLAEYIDDAEKKAEPLFSSDNVEREAPVENLEVLDIAAGFGRPDDDNEEARENDNAEEEPESTEDTRDLKLKSKIPDRTENEGSSGHEKKIREKDRNSDIDVEGNTEPLKVTHLETELSLPAGSKDFGDLSRDTLFDLLIDLYQQKRNGVLIIKNNRVVFRLFFYDGDVVLAEASKLELGLANWLKKEGYINNSEYEELHRETSSLNTIQKGAAVVSRGIVGPREMNRLLKKYYEFLAINAMAWKEGTWRFEKSAKASTGDTSVMIDASTPALVFKGIILNATQNDVETWVPTGAPLKKVSKGIVRLADLEVDETEKRLLDACDGTDQIWNQVLENRFEKVRFHKLLAAFKKLGFIDTVDKGIEALKRKNESPNEPFAVLSSNSIRKSPPAPSNSYEMNYLSPNVPPTSHAQELSAQVLRDWVYKKMETVKEGSYYDILEVSKTDGIKEIEEARNRLLSIFDRQQVSALGVFELDAEIQLIRYIVEEAYAILVHPTIGKQYRQAK